MSLFDWLPWRSEGAGTPEADAVDGRRTGQDAAGSPPTPLAESFVESVDDPALDFTPESLTRLDEFASALSQKEIDTYARAIAAYVGEVFVRAYGAEWALFEEVGWIVEFERGAEEDEVLLLPQVLEDCLEGGATFALVHDRALDQFDLPGPELSDGEPASVVPEKRSEDLAPGAVEERRQRANDLREAFPDYDLDFSPASLERLDELIAAEFDATPPDVDREDRLAETDPGTVPEGANLTIGGGGAVADIAAYVGEVYRQSYDARWAGSDAMATIVAEGSDGSVEVEPLMLVSAAIEGYVSFARLHDTTAAEVGLAQRG